MTKKKVLVTGGAGFIGSHLCAALLEQGNAVLCLDNLYTGSRENIAPLCGHPDFTFWVRDVTFPVETEVDEIYNLACPASPIHYQNDPIKTIQTSFLGTLHMLELARRSGATLLQASTSEVYGDPHIHPQHEGYWGHVNPIGPRACYDEGKRCAETLCFDYHRQHGVQIKVVRIFNTYGPNMHPHDGRVVSNFIIQALQGAPLTIYGEGTQTRSFCYVTDLVEGLLRMMRSADSLIGPVNLGNPQETTIASLATLVIALTRSASPLHYLPLPSDDPRQRKPDITLAHRELGWAPLVPIEEGLEKTVAYLKARSL